MEVVRQNLRLLPDRKRVVARPFVPGTSVFTAGDARQTRVAARVLALDEAEVETLLAETRRSFSGRHQDLEGLWEEHVSMAERAGLGLDGSTPSRRLLLGAYFTQEYAPETAALCNPSMVMAPGGEVDGRFVLSLRAIGEGHVSSVVFRTGRVDGSGTVLLDDPAPHLVAGHRRPPVYSKEEFAARFTEVGPDPGLAARLLALLGDEFTAEDLDRAVTDRPDDGISEAAMFETARIARWVASSNYNVTFPSGPTSANVLLPAGPADSRGIEDVRLVRFSDGGDAVYYGTYTAFDGFTTLPQLIETRDFSSFRVSTLSGAAVRNKGMAIFPRRIDGRYCALGRLDEESLFVLRSDRVRSWPEAVLVYRPTDGWEAVQMGNSGPPIETDRGWLVLTHGVGPMRRYSIGAMLLDLERPERVVARLEGPLFGPADDERDGYVPNVTYSCGSMVHNGNLVIPYGFSDWGVGFATVSLAELLENMIPV